MLFSCSGDIKLKDSDDEWLVGCECQGPCDEECDCVRMISDEDEPHCFYENVSPHLPVRDCISSLTDTQGLLAVERCGNVIVECNEVRFARVHSYSVT